MIKSILLLIIFLFSFQSFASGDQNSFGDKYCEGNCAEFLFSPFDPTGPLSIDEHFLIQRYTERNTILNQLMFLRAIAKIPVTELVVYRGGSRQHTKIKTIGQIISLNRITSTSADRSIAEKFVTDQILIINSKSSHNISRYSVLDERELILLPGTQLRVDKIYTDKLDRSYKNDIKFIDIMVVELTEI